MAAMVVKQDPNKKNGSNERLFILTWNCNCMHIFREIPFIKPQNDT